MTPNDPEQEVKAQSILSAIQQFREKTLDPSTISKEFRRECVEMCILVEGFNQAQTAQLLNCSMKTIQRDLVYIRAKNALVPGDAFAKELIGEIVLKINNHHDYLLRLSRSKDTKTNEKIGAIAVACKALIDLAELLQSAGYLPTAPKEVQGKFSHEIHAAAELTWEQMKDELAELRSVAQKTSVLTPELDSEIKTLEFKIDKSSVQEGIDQIKQTNNIDTEDGKND